MFPLGPYFAVRLHERAPATIAQIREIVRQLDSEAGLFNVASMEQIVSNRMTRPRLYAVLLGIFATLAGLLAAVGTYGVMAYAVERRTREIGIRVALGARRRQVMTLVLGQSAVWTVLGIAIGLAGAAAVTRYLEGLLFGVTPLEPATFAVVSLLFAVVATIATYVPARRATRVDPMVALRAE